MTRIRLTALGLLMIAALSCRGTVGVGTRRGFAEVYPTIAHQLILDNSNIVVLDFRPPQEYADAHVAGAVSTPFETIEEKLPELLPYQPTTVLVYGGEAGEGERGANLLVAAGFRNVVLIRGGMRKWIEQGYQTVTSR